MTKKCSGNQKQVVQNDKTPIRPMTPKKNGYNPMAPKKIGLSLVTGILFALLSTPIAAQQLDRFYFLIQNAEQVRDSSIQDAVSYWVEAVSLFEGFTSSDKKKGMTAYLNTCVVLGETWINDRNNEQAAKLLKNAIDYTRALAPEEAAPLADLQFQLGRANYYLEYYELSEQAFNESLQLQKNELNASNAIIGRHYTNIGRVQFQRRALYQAIESLETARAHYEIEQENSYDLAMVYSFLARSYEELGDYGQALLVYEQASAKPDQDDLNHPNFFYADMGNINMKKGKPAEAIQLIEKALEHYQHLPKEHTIVSLMRAYLSNAYFKHGEYDQALKHMLQTNTFNREDGSSFVQVDFENRNLLGEIYMGLGQEQNARTTWEHLENWSGYPVVQQNNLQFLPYQNLGKWYLKQKDWDKALHYFERAVEANIRPVLTSEANVVQFAYSYEMLFVFQQMAYLYLQKASNNPEFYHDALQNIQKAIDLIDHLKGTYQQETSILFLQADVRPIYETAIDLAITSYQQTTDPKYLELCFAWMEKSKATLLNQQLGNTSTMRFSAIPDALLQQEKELKARVNHFEQLIYEEAFGDTDSARLKIRKDHFFKASQEYKTLKKELASDFPKYYQLKYEDQGIPLRAVQNTLAEDAGLLSFFMGQQKLYRLLVTKEKLIVHSIPIAPYFKDQILFYYQYCSQQTDQYATAADQRFVALGHDLYLKLIPHELEGIQQLTIIPDGLLFYLPFEALLSQKVNDSDIDFRTLPYLVHQLVINYSEDVALLNMNQPGRAGLVAETSYVGWAPDYAISENQGAVNLQDLPGARLEVDQAATLFNGKAFSGTQATEAAFKNGLTPSTILHLAMHGKTDDQSPLASYLQFVPNPADSMDSRLHAYEIYNLSFQNELAILSACETAYGKIEQGEGVQSIARAFKYAGIPSLITSLWRAEDRSTQELMHLFYEDIRKGASNARALTHAKRTYLLEADKVTAHPFYWANFILSGPDQVLDFSVGKRSWWLLGLMVLLLGIGGMLWRKGNQ